MPGKRKLPVLNARPSEGEGEEPPRPAWHWVLLGAVLVFAAWLPLAWLAEALKGRVIRSLIGVPATPADAESALAALTGGARAAVALVTVGLPIFAMTTGAFAAGYVVGRYGAANTTAQTARAGGLVAAGFTTVLVWSFFGFSLVPLLAFVVLGPAAYWGGIRGQRARARMP